ncbi:VOC family protein [Solirubrobacter soli]|uniref:VOC family protein n=1 Tax=Solirubrobacter soli TaxID=363832 RepID=UPI00040056E1|nr:VOC family protein [Solirubrobacter soli]
MPERDGFAPGTPSWVDLATPDVDNAAAFYGELFGWTTEATGTVEETGGYRFFLSGGKKVAGVSPLMQDGQPVVWSTYFATDDVDALADRVKEFGGESFFDPMDVMDAGRMGFFGHPAAGAFGGWQAGNHKGAELVNEPVSLAWNTLITPHPEDAAAFFGVVFGLATETQRFGGDEYVLFMLGDHAVAGLMSPPPGMPEGAPAFWGVSFAVEDADATAALAIERGGSMLQEPFDMPDIGRIATVTDPWGASFSVAALQS